MVERAPDNSAETVKAQTGCSAVTPPVDPVEPGTPTDPEPEEPVEPTPPEVKTKTICDTTYVLTNTGTKLKPKYVRGEGTATNCREVQEDCEVTYVVERAPDNSAETVKAQTDCAPVAPSPVEPPLPEVKMKTICDTTYVLTNTGTKLKPKYVRGEGTVLNCREVPEDCQVEYSVVRDAANTEEKVTAASDCE